jgi:hypothetical protein
MHWLLIQLLTSIVTVEGVGMTTPHWRRLVTKSEEAIAGYFSWQKFLRKARAHSGLSSQ